MINDISPPEVGPQAPIPDTDLTEAEAHRRILWRCLPSFCELTRRYAAKLKLTERDEIAIETLDEILGITPLTPVDHSTTSSYVADGKSEEYGNELASIEVLSEADSENGPIFYIHINEHAGLERMGLRQERASKMAFYIYSDHWGSGGQSDSKAELARVSIRITIDDAGMVSESLISFRLAPSTLSWETIEERLVKSGTVSSDHSVLEALMNSDDVSENLEDGSSRTLYNLGKYRLEPFPGETRVLATYQQIED